MGVITPKNRIELARDILGGLRDLQPIITGVEVGVLRGHYSKILLQNIPDLRLYCVDNWKNIADRENIKARAYDRLQHKAIILNAHSMDAAKNFDDDSLDFVYIDANHQYHSVWNDLNAWTPKVRKGGIVCGDDYYEIPGSKWGVIPAVNDFIKKFGYELQTSDWDHNSPEEDAHPQWWFIK